MKIILTMMLVILAGCAQPEPVQSTSAQANGGRAEVEQIIAQANETYQLAKEKQHAWTVTGRLLTSARAELQQGEVEAAKMTAQRALFTAEASVAQAKTQAEAWQARVPN